MFAAIYENQTKKRRHVALYSNKLKHYISKLMHLPNDSINVQGKNTEDSTVSVPFILPV